MKFRYIIERIGKNGSRDLSSEDFEVESLLVGRGGASNLVLQGRLVSLVHAKFSFNQGVPFIEDNNSVSGVKVNGRLTKRSELKSGDLVQIGEFVFDVNINSGVIELKREIEEVQSESKEIVLEKHVRSLNISSYLPSIRFFSFLGVALAILGFLALPLFGGWHSAWNSGNIANVHKMIEGDCTTCHAKPFKHVNDSDCIKCHNLSDHGHELTELTTSHPDLDKRCAQCHMDHNGDNGLVTTNSKLCLECHKDLNNLKSDVKVMDVNSFDTHPEFKVDISGTERVSLDDRARLKDNTPIKLNHSLHMKVDKNGSGERIIMECSTCHELNADYKTIKPINFDRNCRDCHSLGFDDRIPNVQVPHGDAEAVYPTLFTEYTKLLLMKGGGESYSAREFGRNKPGGTEVFEEQKGNTNYKTVIAEARQAEKQLFTKTGCFLCHETLSKTVSQQTSSNSHYSIDDAKIPSQWFKKSRFDHGGHEEISCESCHANVRNSTATLDVLLPGVKECQKCHAQKEREGFVTSPCVMCHNFHDSLPIEKNRKRSIADYLSFVSRGGKVK